ncbi:winged helix-turn-helix domain-containing protein [Nocardiopsis sp. CNT-189]|uniref:helix-turn-helix domain-containing protein n=1 Tax=Nocardiopsis oceanisediminis TaxID=2816862 RepID=UPI003B335849
MTYVPEGNAIFYQSQALAWVLPLYRLTTTEHDVWNTMLGRMEDGGRVPLSRADIALRLNTAPTNISPALSRLQELGLLWKVSADLWQINPNVAFKGTTEEWQEALDSVPAEVPPVPMPDHDVRPPRRRKKLSVA